MTVLNIHYVLNIRPTVSTLSWIVVLSYQF